MGACLSRKKDSSSSSSPPSSLNVRVAPKKFLDSDTPLKGDLPELQIKSKEEEEKVKKQVAEEENFVKKEIFVIKHRKSHDRERPCVPKQEEEHKVVSVVSNNSENCSSVVRTSSCTKEEVDAILIQCGRLSRSNSSGPAAAKAAASSGRKYAGSKRSYDLDHDQDELAAAASSSSSADYEARKRDGEEEDDEDRRQHRQRHRQSGRRTHSSPSQGRRRTPSRERDRDQRSGSRERGNGSSTSSGRRVSRSPGRRSETTPIPNSNGTITNTTSRPGKMVSVPATVSMDKSNNGVESQTSGTGIKRISVKRNAGEAAGTRTAVSPRSKSPARCNARGGSNENNQQHQPSLSRSNSRKAEHSPYRRNPLSEIDPNSLVYAPTTTGNNKNNSGTGRVQAKSREAEVQAVVKEVVDQAQIQKPNAQGNNKNVKEQTAVVEEAKAMPQTLTRSRSARRSRDFDFNPETPMNPNPSYTALLLEDIQNFHQKNTNTNTSADANATPNAPSFSVPACLSKACSILEAVADLNSTTSSNLSCSFAEDKRIPPKTVGKKLVDVKDPFLESVVISDDLMEPSLHKYVTVRRGGSGTSCGEDMDGQESSGSNSFVGGGGSHNNHWGYSTSSWEPNSADSTDHWTSRSNTREDGERSPLGFQQHVISETGLDMEEARRGFSGQRTGIGRRFNPIVAAAST